VALHCRARAMASGGGAGGSACAESPPGGTTRSDWLRYTMFLAVLILTLSTAMFFFYFQAVCQRILQREFDRDYFLPIVNANRLEFPSVQKVLEEFGAPLEYSRFRMMLKCDYLALTYLLKTAANQSRRYSIDDRLLMAYFRLSFLSLSLRHVFRLGERRVVLRLTSILQYFGNTVGRRVALAKMGDVSASEYFLTL
jgi:hypothetical protein